MVEVGSLEVGGKIQTNQIESGLNRIETGFKDVEKSAKSVNSDFERLNQGSLRLSKKMGALALAGGAAMVAIASQAPATAGAMAKIKVASGELQRSLGRALAPAFEEVSEGFNNFVSWVEDNEDIINFFVTTTLGGFRDALSGIRTAWDWITDNVKDISAKLGFELDLGPVLKGIYEHVGPEIIAGLIGLRFGGVWGGVGAAATVGIGRRIDNPELISQEQEIGLWGGSGSNILNMGIDDIILNWFSRRSRQQEELSDMS